MVTTADGLFEMHTVPRPTPLASEVLIKVAAAGVNPVDWKTASAQSPARQRFDPTKPMIVGWDVAGEVVAKGPGVTRFELGDRVFGMPRFPHPAEAYAQYVASRSREIAATPSNVTDIEAAAVPLAGLTAWQALVDTLDVGPGTRLFINAASGGVGHLAVQIAKAKGAEVWGTASPAKHDWLRDLGVDHVIDRSEPWEHTVTEMDAVFDLYAQQGSPTRALSTLRPGGKLVVITPVEMPDHQALDAAGVSATWILVEPDYASLEAIAEMMLLGTLKVAVGETRPLAEVAQLHESGRTGGVTGKLVATIS